MKHCNVVKFTTAGIITLTIASTLSIGALSYATSGPGGAPPNGGGGGGNSQSSVSYSGAYTFSSDSSESGKSYNTSKASQNTVLVSGGTTTLKNAAVNKTGSASDENSDFYGTNAAILTYNSAKLNISDSTITTNGGHANAVFAYGSSSITISDSKITTSANNSGAIMVTGGGTLTANNVTATTSGNSSAPIRSDRGGGTMTVNGGEYTSNGVGSPVIYSTADVTVNDAKLVSTKSEGAVIEGLNSITLNNTTLTDTNTTLNGQSETYKNVFIYQSMSGDATVGTGTFTAKDSTLITNKGDDFFVTNTTAVINLTNTKITNNADGAFLRAQAGKWGNSGSNGGKVTLNASDQEMTGDIVIDSISTLTMKMSKGSYYRGTINGDKTAKSIAISLSSDSVIVLEGDSYITSLTNADSTNQNIYLNGHKLYVNGEEVSGNTGTPPTGKTGGTEEAADIEATEETDCIGGEDTDCMEAEESEFNPLWAILGGVAVVIVLSAVGLIVVKKKSKKTEENNPTQQNPTQPQM